MTVRRIVLALAWVTLALAFISGLWLTWWLYLLVLSLQIPAWVLLDRLNEAWKCREAETQAMDRLIRESRARGQGARAPQSWPLWNYRPVSADPLSAKSASSGLPRSGEPHSVLPERNRE